MLNLIKYILFIKLFLIASTENVFASRILVVFPMPAQSHFFVGEALSKGLVNAGHEVTLISPYVSKSENITSVVLTGVAEAQKEKFQGENTLNLFGNMKMVAIIPILYMMGAEMANTTFNHPNVQKLLNDKTQKFDIVVLELFCIDALFGLGQHYDASIVGLSTFGPSLWSNDLDGNPSPTSFIGHPFGDFPEKMNFWYRIQNFLITAYEDALLAALHHPKQRALYNTMFPNAIHSYDAVMKNISLVLLNNHFSLSRPKPFGPNTIEVGGMHVNRNPKPLPKDILEFIESSKDGVIYFSLGSNLRSCDLSDERRAAFTNSFSKLKQKVIWKFENETIPMPKNVLVRNWLPQTDILSHPNVKVFISHGGLLGTTESIYYGVPIIGIPFYGDQGLNVQRAVEAGWALKIDHTNITEQSVSWALKELLENKKYTIAIGEISKRYRDQPMTPLETAVYWIEYVIRHNGAHHLRSAGVNLSYLQYHNIDVFLVLIISVIVIFKLLGFIFRKLCKRTKNDLKNDNQKKKL